MLTITRTKLFGLTGGIACGKSTVAQIFREKGCNIIDADAICHDLYSSKNETLMRAIIHRWGKDKILDSNGNIIRSKIAEIVFNDQKELDWLNNILHPLILNKAQEKFEKSDRITLFDAPLLFETGWQEYFYKVITVWAPEQIILKRIRRRNPDWSAHEIYSRLRAQKPINKKLEKADYGIINSIPINLVREQCSKIKNKLERFYNE